MADELTTNYEWEKPDVAADDGTWGGILNTALDDIDNDLKFVQDLIGFRYAASGSVSAAAACDIAVPADGRDFRLVLMNVRTSAQTVLRMLFDHGAGVVTTGYAGMLEARQYGETAIAFTDYTGAAGIAMSRGQVGAAVPTRFEIGLNLPQTVDGFGPIIMGRGRYPGSSINVGNPERSSFEGTPSVSADRVTSIRIKADSGTVTLSYVLLSAANS